jgi:hypothetical protein
MSTFRYLSDESAAATAEWVVASALVVGLGLGAVLLMRGGTGTLGTEVEEALSGATVSSMGIVGSPVSAAGGAPAEGGTSGEDGGAQAGGPEVGAGMTTNPLLVGVGTQDCDWFCLHARFHEAENGPYDPIEWGPDVNHWANERVAEFERYTTDFLHGTLTSYSWINPGNTSEPYLSYYRAEEQIIRNIITQRGG